MSSYQSNSFLITAENSGFEQDKILSLKINILKLQAGLEKCNKNKGKLNQKYNDITAKLNNFWK